MPRARSLKANAGDLSDEPSAARGPLDWMVTKNAPSAPSESEVGRETSVASVFTKNELQIVAEIERRMLVALTVLQNDLERLVATTDLINSMTALLPEERDLLMRNQHSVANQPNQTRLQAAYYDATERGLERGTPEYLAYIRDRMPGADTGSGVAGTRESNTPLPRLNEAQKRAAKDSGVDESTMRRCSR
jgi:hypothetical protein